MYITIRNVCWWFSRPSLTTISFLLDEGVCIILKLSFPLYVLFIIFNKPYPVRGALTLQTRYQVFRHFDFGVRQTIFAGFWLIAESVGDWWVVVFESRLGGSIHATGCVGGEGWVVVGFVSFKYFSSGSLWIKQIWVWVFLVEVFVCEIIIQHGWLHGHLITIETVRLWHELITV